MLRKNKFYRDTYWNLDKPYLAPSASALALYGVKKEISFSAFCAGV